MKARQVKKIGRKAAKNERYFQGGQSLIAQWVLDRTPSKKHPATEKVKLSGPTPSNEPATPWNR
jgi:hypothetical protein